MTYVADMCVRWKTEAMEFGGTKKKKKKAEFSQNVTLSWPLVKYFALHFQHLGTRAAVMDLDCYQMLSFTHELVPSEVRP